MRQGQCGDQKDDGQGDAARGRVERGHEAPADVGMKKKRDRLQPHRDHVGLGPRASMLASGVFTGSTGWQFR
jgi:hypothetical protein